MKKKNEDRFAICARGYDRACVDSFIALEKAKADELQSRQRECINALKAENDNLKKELAIFKSREEQIKLALVNASDSAKRFEKDVKARYETEIQRLRLFRAKWINAYEQLKERYHFDKDALNVESVAVSVEIELKKMLAKDFALDKAPIENKMEEHFRKEVERLADLQIAHQSKRSGEADVYSAIGESVEPVQSLQNNALRSGINVVGGLEPDDKSENGSLSYVDKSLDGGEVQVLKKKLDDIKAKRKKTSGESVAFSLDEALSPTGSLEQNCQALSLAKK